MITAKQAIALGKSGWWKGLPARDIVQFQLFTDLLCMDFSDFHKALEEALERPVWTHELAAIDGIRSEFLGGKKAPTFVEIMEMIPKEKLIVVTV